VRGLIALVAALALLAAVAADPVQWLRPQPAIGVLGALDAPLDVGPGLEPGVVSAQGPPNVLSRLPGAALRPAGPRDGEELLRFRKEANPVQRIPQRPETLTGYRWPVTAIRITQPFGPARDGSRIVNGQPFHDGIDLATFCGDRLYAAHDGVVLAAGRAVDEFMGWLGDLSPYIDRLDEKHLWTTLPIVVVIDDGNGYRSLYAHFSKIAVAAGQSVTAGTFLGWEGRTGNATGCHLHYGLFNPDEPGRMAIDPAVVQRMLVPAFEVARIDPLRVLPR
jgi:murein DD-endopeptidase MepM/ murein hydrolase activator NlpD